MQNLLLQDSPDFHCAVADSRDIFLKKSAELHTHLSPANVGRRGDAEWSRLIVLLSEIITAELFYNLARFHASLKDILVFKKDLFFSQSLLKPLITLHDSMRP